MALFFPLQKVEISRADSFVGKEVFLNQGKDRHLAVAPFIGRFVLVPTYCQAYCQEDPKQDAYQATCKL